MSDFKDIRWRQRFENFTKAYKSLEKYIGEDMSSEIVRAGVIQLFEVAFELAWKVMKDYLEAESLLVRSPRETIKQAYQIELISDGHLWLEALSARNMTAHTYDEEMAMKMVESVKSAYFPLIEALYKKLSEVY